MAPTTTTGEGQNLGTEKALGSDTILTNSESSEILRCPWMNDPLMRRPKVMNKTHEDKNSGFKVHASRFEALYSASETFGHDELVGE